MGGLLPEPIARQQTALLSPGTEEAATIAIRAGVPIFGTDASRNRPERTMSAKVTTIAT
jgi:hypothetical protein